jgi:LemA protein
VATVKGYAAHETELLELVISARNAAAAQSGAGESQARDETELVNKVNLLLARVEAYPELRSSQQFLALQKELSNTEDRIAAARRFYNHNVKELNSLVLGFPSSIIAGMQGMKELPFFEVAELGIHQVPSLAGLNPAMVPAQPEQPRLSP